jgi:zinc/manganese transport system substrate-binding protein
MSNRSRLVLIVALVAPASSAWAAPRLHVVTTTNYTASLVKTLGGDKVDVAALVPAGFNADTYAPRPQDLFKIHRADLFITVGLNLEDWARDLVNAANNPNLVKAEIYHGIPLLDVPKGTVDYSFGDIHPNGNPHFQLNPEDGRLMARNIMKALMFVDPADKDVFAKNLKDFEAELSKAEIRWQAEMAPFKGTAVLPYHESWTYFADAYQLTIPEPPKTIEAKPGFVPSPRRIQEVVQIAKEGKVKVIVTEPYYDVAIAKEVAEQLGVPCLVISLYDIGLDSKQKDYISMVDSIVNQFVQALSGHGH